jgi:hypothetical protein
MAQSPRTLKVQIVADMSKLEDQMAALEARFKCEALMAAMVKATNAALEFESALRLLGDLLRTPSEEA